MIARPASIVSQVTADLETRIYCGTIPPGSKIRESALAEELGVSRGPVREACRSLEAERILTVLPQRGSFVRRVTPGEAGQLFDIRGALSAMIARAIVATAEAGLADRLTGLADGMGEGIAARDLEGFFPRNIAFHRTLLAGTGNARLAEIFMGLFKELRLFRIQSFIAERSRPERVLAYNTASNKGHHLIAAAVASGDAVQLERALLDQTLDSRRRSAEAFRDATAERRSA